MIMTVNNMQSKHYWLYVLRLEEDKFYIGITSHTPEERFQQHKNGFLAAEWTKLYKPLSIEQTKDLGVTTLHKAEEFENQITRLYVRKYGLDNVRGGNITYSGKIVRKGKYLWRFEDWEQYKNIWILAILFGILAAYTVWDIVVRHM